MKHFIRYIHNHTPKIDINRTPSGDEIELNSKHFLWNTLSNSFNRWTNSVWIVSIYRPNNRTVAMATGRGLQGARVQAGRADGRAGRRVSRQPKSTHFGSYFILLHTALTLFLIQI